MSPPRRGRAKKSITLRPNATSLIDAVGWRGVAFCKGKHEDGVGPAASGEDRAMKNILMTASAVALGAGAAVAGGVERSTQSVAILFEKGNYAELSFGFASPDVSGSVGGAVSGDMAGDYFSFSLGYKQALTDQVDLAVILDQPIGANVDYTASGTYPLRGSTADLTSTAITGLVRYKLPSSLSVYGGLRAESVKGVVSLPLVAAYTLNTNTDYAFGYVFGAAWERPDIMARVALTYNSAITHTLDANESTVPTGATTGSFETEVPQSVNLEFQTGISRKAQLLLFGSIKWQEWSAFTIQPPTYNLVIGGPLVSYQSDRITYTLGLGKRFNENWSGAVTVGYEPKNGDVTGNLGPTDGFKSLGLGVTYEMDNMKITGGVRYVEIGDARTTIGANFTDNSALAAGVKVGWTF
jgi:long-chain fatty acid transport protein